MHHFLFVFSKQKFYKMKLKKHLLIQKAIFQYFAKILFFNLFKKKY